MIKIAISATFSDAKITMNADYGEALYLSGALPCIIPPSRDGKMIRETAKFFDGLLLAGGGDVCPDIYGEKAECEIWSLCRERDEFELLLFDAFYACKKPILGICRGHQLINVALGGTLFQDIPGHREGSHGIALSGKMAELAKKTDAKTNSYHHQAIKKLGNGLKASAVSEDGIIEAVDNCGDSYLRGVQFHPEKIFKNDDFSEKIIKDFVKAAKTFK